MLLLTVAIVVVLPPLPPVAGAQSAASSPALQLCRSYVTPCQRELNLPIGGQTTLDLRLAAPQSNPSWNPLSLVAWYARILVHGDTASPVMDSAASGRPVQESGATNLALEGMKSFSVQTGQFGQGPTPYLRIQNSYDPTVGLLEYGVTLVGHLSGQSSPIALQLKSGEELLLGRVTLFAERPGRTLLLDDTSAPDASNLVVLDNAGNLGTMGINATGPLAAVNVGPRAEKARLAGRLRPNLRFPAVDSTGETETFQDRFMVEFWKRDAVPTWRGGGDLPLATFSNLAVDAAGQFIIPDLAPELLPPGIYDLRVQAKGYLPVLAQGVGIDTPAHGAEQLPVWVEANFASPSARDLNGDHVVNEADLEIIRSRFGEPATTNETEPGADINYDGIIDGQDFSLLAVNFGKVGD